MQRSSTMFPVMSLLLGSFLCGSGSTALAISVGQVDDFEDATTMGWTQGRRSIAPGNVATGGPAGAGDHFLRNDASGGDGPGGRQMIFNRTQWTGDFLAAGVTAVTADVNNLGDTSLSLRLALDIDDEPGTRDRLVSTDAVVVPPQSGWIRV